MFRALISVETETELLDAAQTLKLRSVDQSHHQLAFIGISLETDDVVNWIAIDAFRHCANINRQTLDWEVSRSYDLHDFSGLTGKPCLNLVNPVKRFSWSSVPCLRLKFLDFPIFLDLNGFPAFVKSPNT